MPPSPETRVGRKTTRAALSSGQSVLQGTQGRPGTRSRALHDPGPTHWARIWPHGSGLQPSLRGRLPFSTPCSQENTTTEVRLRSF